MSAREKLLDILNHTPSHIVDEMWPDDPITLDGIAGLLLSEHAHELAEQIREEARQYGEEDAFAMKLAAKLIDPKVP